MAIPFLLFRKDLVAVNAFWFESYRLFLPALHEALARSLEEEVSNRVVSFHPGTVFGAFVVTFEVKEASAGLAFEGTSAIAKIHSERTSNGNLTYIRLHEETLARRDTLVRLRVTVGHRLE